MEWLPPQGAGMGVGVGSGLSVRAAGRVDVRVLGRRRVADWLAKEPTIPLRTDTKRLDRVVDECRARDTWWSA